WNLKMRRVVLKEELLGLFWCSMRINKKILLKVIGLDLLFIFLFFLISSFFIKKIYEIILKIQELGMQLNVIENMDQVPDLNMLNIILEQLKVYLGQIIGFLIIFIIITFLLYIVIKSLMWNLIYNGKIKNYKKYFLRFSCFALILFIFLIIIGYEILVYIRQFLISYMFENNFLLKEFSLFLFFSLLLMFVIYIVFTGYVYANEYEIKKVFKLIFRFRKFWLFFVLVGVFLVSYCIIRAGLIISSSIFSILLQVFLVSLIFIWYKIYLCEKLKGGMLTLAQF
ncbi:MAG: hypothetical protein ACTSQG_11480, partial [Promethearchaeota archaeon]